jgi:hypothetical protein
MISLETYRPDFLGVQSGVVYQNAVGNMPVAFDWIGSQVLRCIPMTGIHSVIPHGLQVGERIRVSVQNGSWQGSGVYDVQEIKDVDDGSYNGTLIVIHQLSFAGGISTAAGYWQKALPGEPITPYLGTITGCCAPYQERLTPYSGCIPKCAEGFHRVGEDCVINDCPEGQERLTPSSQCIPKCGTGYKRGLTGACVIDCPAGSIPKYDGTGCVPVCDSGYHNDSITGVCVINDCPEGQERVNGVCIPKCADGQHRDTHGLCVIDTPDNCPTGFHWDEASSKCVQNPVSAKCGWLAELKDGKCVTKTVTVAGMELPEWSLYVGGAVVAGIVIFSIIRNVRKA